MNHLKAIFLFSFLCIVLLSSFQSTPTKDFRLKHFNLEKNVAIEGYDPVSYFQGKPKKGSSSISVSYLGIIYKFSSETNKATFSKAPEKYLPQYGGWCAYAMGEKGEKVEIDPETYKIIEGKLYLFYNAYFTNTLTSWNKDQSKYLNLANQNWAKFK